MKALSITKAVTKNWLRSRSGVFFSFLFPVLFLLVFGSIFGNSNSSTYSLTVQNLDSGSGPPHLSSLFVNALNSTKVLSVNLIGPEVNVTSYIKNQSSYFGSEPRVLIIPKGFQDYLLSGKKVNLTYISNPSDQFAQSVWGIIQNTASLFELRLSNSTQQINIKQSFLGYKLLKPVDYYMPGLIAAFMMTNGVIGLTSVASEFKRRGFLKRLFSTPVTKFDWMIGNIISQTVLALILSGVMILLGIVIYRSSIDISPLVLASLFFGAVLFSGIGMTIAGVVTDPEAASGLGNAIAFPMMFLSGTFWPLDIMPGFLQTVARFLPLTYFSESLRDTMILNNLQQALLNTGVTAAFAIAFIILGSVLTRWEEE